MIVLHVVNNLDKGGAERLLVNNLPGLRNRGILVSLLQISDRKSATEFVAALEDEGISISSITKGTLYSPLHILKLRKFFIKSNFDIVHVHLFPAMYLVAMAIKMMPKSRRPKLIFTEHSIQNKRFNIKLFRPFDRWIYSTYDKVIAISSAIKLQLDSWTADTKKAVVIRNGVRIKQVKDALGYSKGDLSTLFGVTEQCKTMLMSARFAYPKKQIFLIEVLKTLPHNFHLLLAGEGQDMDEAKDRSRHMELENRVHFLGFRNDITRLMKSVDLNILATEYEGMSGVTLEALASGKPFMGSDVTGINDIVPDNRFLFRNDNLKDVANQIESILESESQQISMSRDAEKFVQAFDIEIMLDEQVKLYQSILER